MSQVVLPKNPNNTTGQPAEFAHVYANDEALKSAVNGNLDNGNLADGADIASSKLALFFGGNYRIKFGKTTIFDDGADTSIEQTLSHGFTVTPQVVFAIGNTTAFQINVTAGNYTPTTFTAYAYRADAKISSVPIAWIAIG